MACQLDGFGRKQVKRCGPKAAVGLLGMLPEAKARAANSGNRPLPRFYLLCSAKAMSAKKHFRWLDFWFFSSRKRTKPIRGDWAVRAYIENAVSICINEYRLVKTPPCPSQGRESRGPLLFCSVCMELASLGCLSSSHDAEKELRIYKNKNGCRLFRFDHPFSYFIPYRSTA